MACFAWSVEDIELILHPMIAEKETTGSMGDDTPLLCSQINIEDSITFLDKILVKLQSQLIH